MFQCTCKQKSAVKNNNKNFCGFCSGIRNAARKFSVYLYNMTLIGLTPRSGSLGEAELLCCLPSRWVVVAYREERWHGDQCGANIPAEPIRWSCCCICSTPISPATFPLSLPFMPESLRSGPIPNGELLTAYHQESVWRIVVLTGFEGSAIAILCQEVMLHKSHWN